LYSSPDHSGQVTGVMKTWTVFLLFIGCVGTTVAQTQSASTGQGMQTKIVLEIRTYNLKRGARDNFHQLVLKTLPLLGQYEINVVSYGPSLHDENSYFLIRSFSSLDDRARKEDAFYGSRDWIDGPRESVLALIENYSTIVVEADHSLLPHLQR
jgi:hypothetical protein